jgi:hypothetical protein
VTSLILALVLTSPAQIESPGKQVLHGGKFVWYGTEKQVDPPELPDSDFELPDINPPDFNFDPVEIDAPNINISREGVTIFLIIIGAVGLAILGYHIIRSVRNRKPKPDNHLSELDALDSFPDVESSRGWADLEAWQRHLQRCREYLQRNETESAARELYWAAMAWIRDRRLLVLDDGMSNGEVLSRLRRRQAPWPLFMAIFHSFEALEFGHLAPEVQSLSSLANQLEGSRNDPTG